MFTSANFRGRPFTDFDDDGKDWGTYKLQTAIGRFEIVELLDCYRVTTPEKKTWRVVATALNCNGTLSGVLTLAHCIEIVDAIALELGCADTYAHEVWIPGLLKEGGTAGDLLDRKVEADAYRLDAGDWRLVPHTETGDYVGGSVTRSNLDFLLAQFDEIDPMAYWHSEIRNAHGYRAIAVRADFAGEIVEHFKRLESYPVLDDDLHSEYEHTSYVSARADYLRSHDLASELKIERDSLESMVTRIDDDHAIDELLDLRDNACEETGELWYFKLDGDRREHLEAIITLAMQKAKTITLAVSDIQADVRLQRRAGKLWIAFRSWSSRQWRDKQKTSIQSAAAFLLEN